MSIDPAILLPIDYLWPSNEAGGGTMVNPNEPPPTLASDVNLTSLQAKLAAENVCVGKFDKNFFHLSFSQLKLV